MPVRSSSGLYPWPIAVFIYINDIDYSCPDSNIDLYADDSTL